MSQTIEFLTDADVEVLNRHGVSAIKANTQWSQLTAFSPRVDLDRACTVDDGIKIITASECDALIEAHRQSAEQGRWQKFVPASGAASRMFAFRTGDDKRRFCESLVRFAFVGELKRCLADRGIDLAALLCEGKVDDIVGGVVASEGLDYGNLPKGLIEFHQYPHSTRTPFEEHLLESLACLSDGDGDVRAHFTVSPEHQGRVEQRLNTLEERDACRVTFSVQHPSTDTIAMGANGELVRDVDGRPLLRPGGHGALIENVNELQGDLIFVKNIDNVCHERIRDASVRWIQLLGGYLVQLQDAVHQQLRRLQSDQGTVNDARDFVNETFPGAVLPNKEDPKSMQDALMAHLQRPLRVCGMVKNEGEPGGGPYWVRGKDGNLSPQIVESAELNAQDPQQQAVFQQSTHFNPVFMALAVRDAVGLPFDLRRFVDVERAIITKKQIDGQSATVLEWPGLWNGAMANWNTVFVEVPIDVFSPVKTVFDLLRHEHQPLSNG